MEYTIQKLAKLAGISTRTLRYYDELGLLAPGRVNSSGYRIYGAAEVDLLQQILFYRELGMPLEEIREVVHSPGFDASAALREHRERLVEKRMQLDRLIASVEKTLYAAEGRIVMSDQQKFEAFKREKLEENERSYGQEVRERYGEAAYEESKNQWNGMTEADYRRLCETEEAMLASLLQGMDEKNPSGEAALRAARLHREWITSHWGSYSPQAHAGVARMYVDDERFTAYYDKHREGASRFLRDAVLAYTAGLPRE